MKAHSHGKYGVWLRPAMTNPRNHRRQAPRNARVTLPGWETEACSGVGDDCLATRRVVVFGDSLSSIDAGRVYSVARKSNGKLWARETRGWVEGVLVGLPAARGHECVTFLLFRNVCSQRFGWW